MLSFMHHAWHVAGVPFSLILQPRRCNPNGIQTAESVHKLRLHQCGPQGTGCAAAFGRAVSIAHRSSLTKICRLAICCTHLCVLPDWQRSIAHKHHALRRGGLRQDVWPCLALPCPKLGNKDPDKH